jgi:hypothetical protein
MLIPPDCNFGSIRRRARHSAALGRQCAILSPLLAVSTVLAVLRGRRRGRYRRDDCHRAAPGACRGAALLRATLLPTATLLRAAELLRATLSPLISRRRHSGRPRLVRELRRLRKPATPARGTRQRRAVLADTGLSSCAHHILSLPVNLDGVLKFAPAFLLLAARVAGTRCP